jgi:hypothetical protein
MKPKNLMAHAEDRTARQVPAHFAQNFYSLLHVHLVLLLAAALNTKANHLS